MNKSTIKTIIKELANAPAIAAREVLEQLQTDDERAEALRVFRAVGITPEPPRKNNKKD